MARKPNTASQTAPKNENAEAPAKTSGDLQLKGMGQIVKQGEVVVVKKGQDEKSYCKIQIESEGVNMSFAIARPGLAQYATIGRKVGFQGRVTGVKDGKLTVVGAAFNFLDRPSNADEFDPFGDAE